MCILINGSQPVEWHFLVFFNYICASFHSFSDALVSNVLVSKLGSIRFLIELKIEPTVYLLIYAVPSCLVD